MMEMIGSGILIVTGAIALYIYRDEVRSAGKKVLTKITGTYHKG